MNQTTHFFNLGYGWLCKHCSAENAERKHFHHGERKPQPLAFAKWVEEQHYCGLKCLRCNIEEYVQKPSRLARH